jgi:hypothetical protein
MHIVAETAVIAARTSFAAARQRARPGGCLMIDWISQEFGAPAQASALVAVFSALVAVVSAAFALANARTARLNVRDQMLRYSIDLAERTRTERAVLRDWSPITGAPMPERVREACDKVARTFDIIAFLDRTRTIDRQFVDSFYSGAFIDLWNKALRSYVAEMQAQRSPRHFWELQRFYDRVRYVNDWHPANTRRKDWPKNPRKFHWRRFITRDRN